jgi:Predicted dehydrogenases and related proteins
MRFVLIGAGQRGMIYAKYAYEKGNEIVAAADSDPVKLAAAGEAFRIPEENRFKKGTDLLAMPRLADAAIIATMDRDHYREAIPALEKGYHLLLEKPVSPVPEEILDIERTAQRYGRHITVCHVLRYSPFFRALKETAESGKIGRVITIQHNENIGNFHMAHSFVRGNWRRSDEASSLIMQKSCHDMDLLFWLAGSPCESAASFGDLTYFKAENAPAGSAGRCCDCSLKDSCRFSAYRCYLPVAGNWPATVLTGDQSHDALREAIRTGPYGRCVYHCDNDVCDHQVTILRFANGVTATFNLSGFTSRMTRTIKIMGENGEIRANEYENEIEILRFAPTGTEEPPRELIRPEETLSGHSGGDSGIVEDFLSMLEGKLNESATDIHESVESHMMACAAEEARLSGKVVRISEFRRNHEGKPVR